MEDMKNQQKRKIWKNNIGTENDSETIINSKVKVVYHNVFRFFSKQCEKVWMKLSCDLNENIEVFIPGFPRK